MDGFALPSGCPTNRRVRLPLPISRRTRLPLSSVTDSFPSLSVARQAARWRLQLMASRRSSTTSGSSRGGGSSSSSSSSSIIRRAERRKVVVMATADTETPAFRRLCNDEDRGYGRGEFRASICAREACFRCAKGMPRTVARLPCGVNAAATNRHRCSANSCHLYV
jgi:hypothetical protein